MKKILIFCLIIIFPLYSFAHQPRVEEDSPQNVQNEEDIESQKIENPEISQAFYAELKDGPDRYYIDSGVPFKLYVQLTVADIDGATTDFSAIITKDSEEIARLQGENHEWERWFEEFAGDWYFIGPEIEQDVSAGRYDIEIVSPDNKGKYVLVVGKKEEFSPSEIINTIITLPTLKMDYMGKPWYLVYWNLTGFFIAIMILILLGIVVGIYFIIRKRKKSEKSQGK